MDSQNLFQSKSHLQRPIQFTELGASERPNEACQLRFAEAYEVIAQNPALMFQAFVDTGGDLGRESVAASEDRRADDGGESGVDEDLAAHNDEAPVKFRVVCRMMNAIDFASFHLLISNAAAPLGLWVLIAKNVLHLGIQLMRRFIDEFEIARFDLCPRPSPQILGEHGFDERGARLLRSHDAINAGEYVF
jgi:hypothetical protein